jgi:hypothetical protein
MKIASHLVDARLRVNGVTLSQRQSLEPLEYYHIDLGEHHCILDERAWSESYLEYNENRKSFVNANKFYDTHFYHLTNSLVEKGLSHVADYKDPRHAALLCLKPSSRTSPQTVSLLILICICGQMANGLKGMSLCLARLCLESLLAHKTYDSCLGRATLVS